MYLSIILFVLSSTGKVQTTEGTYKHKMQVQQAKLPMDTSFSTAESSQPDQHPTTEAGTPDKEKAQTKEVQFSDEAATKEVQSNDEAASHQTATEN